MKYIITGERATGKRTVARHLLPSAIICDKYPKSIMPNESLIIEDIGNPKKLADIVEMACHEDDSIQIAIVTQIDIETIVNTIHSEILDKFIIIKL